MVELRDSVHYRRPSITSPQIFRRLNPELSHHEDLYSLTVVDLQILTSDDPKDDAAFRHLAYSVFPRGINTRKRQVIHKLAFSTKSNSLEALKLCWEILDTLYDHLDHVFRQLDALRIAEFRTRRLATFNRWILVLQINVIDRLRSCHVFAEGLNSSGSPDRRALLDLSATKLHRAFEGLVVPTRMLMVSHLVESSMVHSYP